MPQSLRYRYRSAPCLLVLALLVGCAESPTGPRAIHQTAGGHAWVAVTVPAGLSTTLVSDSAGVRVSADGVLGTLSAIDLWSERVEVQVDLERYPEIGRVLREVHGLRARAESALAAGDSLTAARHLEAAAGRIQSQSPAAVALRVLDRTQARLESGEAQGPEAERARRLLRTAREALVYGDPARALQRALYALQIAGGQGIPIAEVEEWDG